LLLAQWLLAVAVQVEPPRAERACEKAPGSPYVVAAIFAGRRDRMGLLLSYLDQLVSTCVLDEVHVWNSTRNIFDEWWVGSLSSRPGYTVLFPEGNTWLQAYLYYSTRGMNETLRIGGEVVPGRFAPAWPGADKNNTVIVKTDDDIVYLDVDRFPCFVDYVRSTPEMFMVHGNIVNNGVTTYYQVHQDPELLELLPELGKYPSVQMDTPFQYLQYGAAGALWENASYAIELHEYFLDHVDRFARKTGPHGEACIVYKPPKQRMGQGRLSIQFFGARWAAFDKISALLVEAPLIEKAHDEYTLTLVATLLPGTVECIFPQMVVSHLAFGHQGPDIFAAVEPGYEALAAREAESFRANPARGAAC